MTTGTPAVRGPIRSATTSVFAMDRFSAGDDYGYGYDPARRKSWDSGPPLELTQRAAHRVSLSLLYTLVGCLDTFDCEDGLFCNGVEPCSSYRLRIRRTGLPGWRPLHDRRLRRGVGRLQSPVGAAAGWRREPGTRPPDAGVVDREPVLGREPRCGVVQRLPRGANGHGRPDLSCRERHRHDHGTTTARSPWVGCSVTSPPP